MAFEDIDFVGANYSKAAVPSDGIRVANRAAPYRQGGAAPKRFITLQIGKDLARKISLTQEQHNLRLLFGTGSDAGLVQVSVDNQTGMFPARRQKTGTYKLTVNSGTADGLFTTDFPAFTQDRIEAIRPQNGKPPHFVFKASAEMLAAMTSEAS